MISMLAAAKKGDHLGEPIPSAIRQMKDHKVFLRSGQLSMIAAASGTGKTLIAHWIAIYSKVPTLYFSADTDRGTMAVRSASMLCGLDQEVVEKDIQDQSGAGWEALQTIGAASHIQWVFKADPSVHDIEEQVAAFYTVYGEYPKLIVVDTLMKVDNPHGSNMDLDHQVAVLDYLQNLARATGAHCSVLHHVTGEYEGGDRIIGQDGLKNKLGNLPEVIITVTRIGDDLRLAFVKVRGGPGRSDGSMGVTLKVGWSNAQIV